ncbi:sensor histidine kinase [Spirillospora sp. NBC_01491]|uniref:sensor histidine kinase n=1 Tax=Spirillospora sp. NBC_01491 TaxID=2976007 RepID=UPI002E353597|nr:histidine kinase [Spirillospora sp. NBC_01491]
MSSAAERGPAPPDGAEVPGEADLTLWSRVGITFRMLMQFRVFLVAMTTVLIPHDRVTPALLFLLAVVGVLSWLVAHAWERFLPRVARHPVLLCLDAFVAYAVLALGGVSGPFFLFTVITSAVAGVLYEWRALLCVCALQMSLFFMAAARTDPPPGAETMIGLPIFYPFAVCAGVGLYRLFEQYAVAIEARHRAETRVAAAEERARLAREMHDSLAKTLHGIGLTATALPVVLRKSPQRAEQQAEAIASAVRVAGQEARALIADLRDDPGDRPFGVVVAQIADAWGRATGVPVRTELPDGDVEPPPNARHEVVAILKEALENVARHAEAAQVEVWIGMEGDLMTLAVRDDGHGSGSLGATTERLEALADAGHYGVVGMTERARRAGGDLAVSSFPGRGTTVMVSVPLGGGAPGGGLRRAAGA